MSTPAIELKNVTKRFGSVIANDNVNLTLEQGEILSILGENGSGKTTLMNMLSGIYYPDEGQIFVGGREVSIQSPKDSFELGIGMIHQHFKLIDVLSAAENIILGLQGEEILKMQEVYAKINELTAKYGFDLDPKEKIYNMSVSQKQTVEIVKVLYRGADMLILDEPTAVLTPQEIQKLFTVLRNMRQAGKSIIIITHKLNEVMELSDRVAVLRKGRYIGCVETAKTSISELTEMMVGEKISLDIHRSQPQDAHKRIEMRGITVRNKEGVRMLNKASFVANSGEILGIAGVAGSGQKELLEAIAGLQETETGGEILYYAPTGETLKLTEMTAENIRNLGIHLSFVPEDRLGMGLVGSMDLTDNMMIRSYRETGHFFAHRKAPRELAEQIVEKLDVVTPGVDTPISHLSGGNVQKMLVGREIAAQPIVLMVAYPVRGLDINSSYTIYNLLNEQKEKGVAVICVGEDIDVLLALCDRIMVMSGGNITGVVDAKSTTKEEIGLMMTGATKEKADHES
ncbi:MAG: ABC transporter ATP-binding protein [Lachnospiraceae bacterium]|nr:ABC transporter ATP-binding protein [Lachnospiraceae bacterium]